MGKKSQRRRQSRNASQAPPAPAMVTASGRINLEAGLPEEQVQAAFQKAVENSTPRVQQLVEMQEQHIQYLYQNMEQMSQMLQANEQMYGNAILSLVGEAPVEVRMKQSDGVAIDLNFEIEGEIDEDPTLIVTVDKAPEPPANPEADKLIAELREQTAAAVEAEEAETYVDTDGKTHEYAPPPEDE